MQIHLVKEEEVEEEEVVSAEILEMEQKVEGVEVRAETIKWQRWSPRSQARTPRTRARTPRTRGRIIDPIRNTMYSLRQLHPIPRIHLSKQMHPLHLSKWMRRYRSSKTRLQPK